MTATKKEKQFELPHAPRFTDYLKSHLEGILTAERELTTPKHVEIWNVFLNDDKLGEYRRIFPIGILERFLFGEMDFSYNDKMFHVNIQ